MRPVRSRTCFSQLYRVIKFVGWIPAKVGIKRYAELFWASLVFFSVIYLPIGFLLSLVKDYEKFTQAEILGLFQTCFNSFGLAAKSITMRLFLRRLNQTQCSLDKMDECLQLDTDRRKIHNAVASSRYVILAYCSVYFGYTLFELVYNLLGGQPPFLIYNPFFNWRNGNGINLFFQAILEYIIIAFNVTVVIIVDSYPLLFIVVIRTHIDILKDHIHSLRIDPLQTEAENYEDLVSCIIHHKLILGSCDLMRPIIARTIFVQFLLIGLVLGLNFINIGNYTDIFDGFSSIFHLVAVLVETFPFCYNCDLLFEECEQLSHLLMQSKWISAEPKYKSTLRIFMLHLQKPIVFIAGGVFPISMNSNIKVAKFAFSVMTIVQQMIQGDRSK